MRSSSLDGYQGGLSMFVTADVLSSTKQIYCSVVWLEVKTALAATHVAVGHW